MKYSEKLEKAIRVAASLHADHHRKGLKPLPYVTHLFSVASIVSNYTEDEDTIIAALLHDTIEDTDYSPSDLEVNFGKKVCEIVLGVTEPHDEISWDRRKEGYIEGLKKAPEESLIIAAADKIHNLHSSVEEFGDDLEEFFKHFSGNAESRIAYYQKIVGIIEERLDNPIVEQLTKAFELYKVFLQKAS